MARVRWSLVLILAVAGIVPVHGDAVAQSASDDGAPSAIPIGSSPSDDEYEIGPNDVIQLQVSGSEEIERLVTVDPAGKIQAPLLGALEAAGKTPAELTEELTERYQLIDPSVTEALVSVAKYNSRTLTFIGAVGAPGTYGFREIPDIWDAMLTAGGALPEAELARVQIVRREREFDEPRTIRVNLARGIEGTAPSNLPELRPRDTIIVPVLDEASTAPDGFRIFGAIETPGSYSLSQASTLLDALAIAGGRGDGADLGSVRLLRRSPTGLMAYEIDVEAYLETANPPMAFALRAGDTITVPQRQSFFEQFNQYLGPLISIASLIVIINRTN